MGKFGVTPQKEAELERRMAACGVTESDLDESFVRSGGPEVKMQQARSQGLNRFYARRRLCELIEAQEMGEDSPEARKRAKLRKQKARRRRKTKKKLDDGSAEGPQD